MAMHLQGKRAMSHLEEEIHEEDILVNLEVVMVMHLQGKGTACHIKVGDK
jgi:hypothetical protein